jgi:hypothetical protein
MLFKSFTGLSVQQFDAIFKETESISKTRDKASFFQKRKKRRAVGSGRHFNLLVKDRVIMVLVLQALYHLYPDGISIWFGWTRVTYAGRDIHIYNSTVYGFSFLNHAPEHDDAQCVSSPSSPLVCMK